jgi:hypothetical protein
VSRAARRLIVALAVALVSLLVSASAMAQADDTYYEDTDPAALTDFREPLDPHGTWVDDPDYGTVWVPDAVVVGADFAPYRTAGRWAVSDTGDWVWVSDYSWGYIPFHYGRWVWISARGWAWVPGRTYAPAWVVWRVGAPGYGYVGWAPMPPRYYWYGGFAVGVYGALTMPFWFCPSYWMFSPYWHMHIVPRRHVRHVARHTHVYRGHRRARGRAFGGGTGRGHRKAQPSVGGAGGAVPKSGPLPAKRADGLDRGADRRAASFAQRPASPSFKEAQIPRDRVPSKRVRVDRRAAKLARAPRGYKAKRAELRKRPMKVRPSPASRAARRATPSRTGIGRGRMGRSSGRSYSQPGRRGGFSRAQPGSRYRPSQRYQNPSNRRGYAPPRRVPRSPQRAAPSRGYQAPRGRPAGRSPSRTTVPRRAPSRAAPPRRAPPRGTTPRRSTPSRARSAPSRSRSSGASRSRGSSRSSGASRSRGSSRSGGSSGGRSGGRSGGGRRR